MARNNPVRGNYLLVGIDLVRAGIRTIAGVGTVFAREDNGDVIPSIDPRTERWVTSRAVASAAPKAGVPLLMSAVPANVILPFLQQDPKAKVRTTEEHIVHMLGGETPEHRAYAIKQIELLEETYAVAAPAATQVA